MRIVGRVGLARRQRKPRPDPARLIAEAAAAREDADWALAAARYGEAARLAGTDAGLWLQHGHMLKEAGLLGKASESYRRARAITPEDPEIPLQEAILAKLSGAAVEARAGFAHARRLGYPDAEFLDREVDFLDATEDARSFSQGPRVVLGDTVAIYLSSVLGPPPDTVADLDGFLGFTDYSYSFSMRGYIDGFEAIGARYELVNAVQNIADVRRSSDAAVNVHFGFYPPDKPRMLKGAYNVLVTALEFERLRLAHEHTAHHAFADPAVTLALADEMWTVSRFGAEAIARSGLDGARTVPAPVLGRLAVDARAAPPDSRTVSKNAGRLGRVDWIPLAVSRIFQPALTAEAERRRRPLRALLDAARDRPPVVFLTVFNIADWRKQILPMLEAFTRFAKTRPNAFLLLKINTTNRRTLDLNVELLQEQVTRSGELAPPLVSDRIWLSSEPLTREELTTLYDLAAFYVCTSHGEGQNLPLIEAMGRGAVALSVDHTGMADYLTPANGLVIPSRRGPFSARLRARYQMGDISTWYVTAPDVYETLERAFALDDAAYSHLSRAGMATVKDTFGLAPFRAALAEVIARARRHLPDVG